MSAQVETPSADAATPVPDAAPGGEAPPEAAATPAPDPALTPLPETPGEDAMAGAEVLRDAVSDQSMTVAAIIDRLDAAGFTVGDTRFSLWTALVFLLVIVAVFLFARIGSKIAHGLFKRVTRFDPAQRLLGEKLLTIAVWALAILVGIDILGIDLTALAVFSGAFGLAIGFGLQKTFGNLIAGLILLMDRSIKPGDVIAVSDMSGRESFGEIRKIGIRAVSIVTRDRKEYLIPNENLMINQVENWSYSSREVRVKAPIGVAYGTDLDLAERLMMQATVDAPRVLSEPRPAVRLMAFGESSIDFEIRFWITDPEDGVNGVRSEVYKRMWRLFQDHGIEIPYPQREIALADNAQFRRLLAAIVGKEEADQASADKAV